MILVSISGWIYSINYENWVLKQIIYIKTTVTSRINVVQDDIARY